MVSPKYSLVVPVYNEEKNILELYRRVSAVGEQLDGAIELIFVNDGSRDRTLQIVRDLHQNDLRVSYLSLARNFGHQIAVTAGLNFARGEVAIVMDADLQDPPELILEMVAKWQNGFQVVYAQRTQRQKKVGSNAVRHTYFIACSNTLLMSIFPPTLEISV